MSSLRAWRLPHLVMWLRCCWIESALGERVDQVLAAKPGLMLLGPALLALAVDVAVAQQRLGHLVARCGVRPAQVVAGSDQIAQPDTAFR